MGWELTLDTGAGAATAVWEVASGLPHALGLATPTGGRISEATDSSPSGRVWPVGTTALGASCSRWRRVIEAT